MSHRDALLQLKTYMGEQIFGQEQLIERILICLLAGGHVLVEATDGDERVGGTKSSGIEGAAQVGGLPAGAGEALEVAVRGVVGSAR